MLKDKHLVVSPETHKKIVDEAKKANDSKLKPFTEEIIKDGFKLRRMK